MKLVRKLLAQYQLVTSTWLNDLSKQVWGTTAAVLWSLFRDRDNEFGTVFLGDAAKPVASGSDNTLDLQPGLAILLDTNINDKFLSDVAPVFLTQVQPIQFTTNEAAEDRIDSVFIRAKDVEEDESDALFRDPETKKKSKREVAHTSRYGWETQVVEGEPASSPSAPSTPTGWVRVADVERPASQVNVLDGDVTDRRDRGAIAPGGANFSDDVWNLDGVEMYFAQSDTVFARLYRSSGSATMNLVTHAVGATPDGVLNLGTLTAYSYLAADKIRGALGDTIQLLDYDGNTPAGLQTSFLKPNSGDTISIKDSGGTDGAGAIEAANVIGARCNVDIDNGDGSVNQIDNGYNIDSVTKQGDSTYYIRFTTDPPNAGEFVTMASFADEPPADSYIRVREASDGSGAYAVVEMKTDAAGDVHRSFNFMAMWDY